MGVSMEVNIVGSIRFKISIANSMKVYKGVSIGRRYWVNIESSLGVIMLDSIGVSKAGSI